MQRNPFVNQKYTREATVPQILCFQTGSHLRTDRKSVALVGKGISCSILEHDSKPVPGNLSCRGDNGGGPTVGRRRQLWRLRHFCKWM